MNRAHLMAVAVAGVVVPAFAIVSAATTLGVHIAQEIALAGVATLALVGLGASGPSVTRR